VASELFRGDACLLQNSTQCTNGEFRMQWNDTTDGSFGFCTLKHRVTSTLPNLAEAKA
jgi:hypothetical protein